MANTPPLANLAISHPAVPPKAQPKSPSPRSGGEEQFMLLRRKVQTSELLSASSEALLRSLSFSGKLTVILENGRIVKSGYQEGYFRRKDDLHI